MLPTSLRLADSNHSHLHTHTCKRLCYAFQLLLRYKLHKFYSLILLLQKFVYSIWLMCVCAYAGPFFYLPALPLFCLSACLFTYLYLYLYECTKEKSI